MARPRSDVDLRKMDAAKQPKRRRKPRNKPDPLPAVADQKAGAREFAESLPAMPGIAQEWCKDHWKVTAPHNDATLWELQLIQTFGTRSRALLKTFVDQLSKLCPDVWDADRQEWKTNETEWNALLALVADHRPENSAQACLAAQMAATHLMMMRVSEHALNRGYVVLERDAGLASKLARTFAIQCETMQALQGKARTAKQSIHVTKEVHTHAHYHDHRGEGDENSNQSDATDTGAESIEGSPSLSGANQEGAIVRLSSRKGKARL